MVSALSALVFQKSMSPLFSLALLLVVDLAIDNGNESDLCIGLIIYFLIRSKKIRLT